MPAPHRDTAPVTGNTNYNTVAANVTAQALTDLTNGAAAAIGGAKGDYLDMLTITPSSTSPGPVTILDGVTSIPVFAGGSSSLGGLVPFNVYLQMFSQNGPWSITTGGNVTVIATGLFT